MRTLISLLVTATIAIGLISIQSCEEENNEPANQAPTVSITNPKSGDEITRGEVVTITTEAEDEDGNLKEVRFYIDSTGIGIDDNEPFSYEWETASAAEGSHTIKVVALDKEMAEAEEELEVKVVSAGGKPMAAFFVNSTSVEEGDSIQFFDESTGQPTGWEWDFGDGNTSTKQYPVHAYTTEGNYDVELKVYNDQGADTLNKKDYIDVTAIGSAPVAVFSADPTAIAEGNVVNFTDHSYSNPTSWFWDFGDGTTSEEQNPTHTYTTTPANGLFYTVELRVTNEFGSDTSIKTDYIRVAEVLEPDFSASQTNGEAFFVVHFSGYVGSCCNSYSWDFGDGNTSARKNPIHVYSSEGTYTVKLTVEDNYGSYTETKTNYIEVIGNSTPPSGYFTDPRDGQEYPYIEIGSQTWMAENLNYASDQSWWYENDEHYGEIFGRLYSWSAASEACPEGWHLPSDEEWKTLEMELGMSQSEADATGYRGTDQGKQMKHTSGWLNGNGNNSAGFNGLPGGFYEESEYVWLGSATKWWTATKTEPVLAYNRYLFGNNGVGRKVWIITDRFSVRCVKD